VPHDRLAALVGQAALLQLLVYLVLEQLFLLLQLTQVLVLLVEQVLL
jgi:hypothetical protein